jgi:ER membrane protein complex subunit 2
MSSSLLHPPAHLPPSVALQLSQQAPALLRNVPSSISSYSLSSLWSAAESPELWTTYENLMLSCLRTGDEESARLCLGRLTERFGTDNERLLALIGLYDEATAQNDTELKKVLDTYETILKNDPSNMVNCASLLKMDLLILGQPVSKRRIALLRSMKRATEAITALNKFLDSSPTDAEAWAELADLYVSQGMFQQAIFALEEVLLIAPNAWNVSIHNWPPWQTILTLRCRSTLDSVRFYTWLPQQVMWGRRRSTLQIHSGDSAEALSYVMIIFVVTMG